MRSITRRIKQPLSISSSSCPYPSPPPPLEFSSSLFLLLPPRPPPHKHDKKFHFRRLLCARATRAFALLETLARQKKGLGFALFWLVLLSAGDYGGWWQWYGSNIHSSLEVVHRNVVATMVGMTWNGYHIASLYANCKNRNTDNAKSHTYNMYSH